MKIKKYVVDSLPDAMQQIKQELGQEAIIINTKKVKTGGFLGLFRKQQVEVLAAIDPERSYQPSVKPVVKPTIKQVAKPQQQPGTPALSTKEQRLSMVDSDVIGEMKSITNYLLTLMLEKDELVSPALKKVKEALLSHDVSQEITMELLAKLLVRMESNKSYTERDLLAWSKAEIVSFIRDKGWRENQQLSKITCFIGSTGVGKTTTIAKLAADFMLSQNKQVGLITSDTYRVAAVEQLKTYATILKIPLEVVYSPQDLQQALQRLASCDLILMDTAGRNYLEHEFVDELKQLLGHAEEVSTSMVLSLTAKYQDIKEIIASFNPDQINSLLFTKLDETKSYGMLLNIINEYGIPFSYVTNGQNVPDDIRFVTPEDIAELIMGEDAHA